MHPVAEEWLAEFVALETGDDGMTSAELAVLWGIPDRTARSILQRGVQTGRYIQGWCIRDTGAGRRRLPVYRIAKSSGVAKKSKRKGAR